MPNLNAFYMGLLLTTTLLVACSGDENCLDTDDDYCDEVVVTDGDADTDADSDSDSDNAIPAHCYPLNCELGQFYCTGYTGPDHEWGLSERTRVRGRVNECVVIHTGCPGLQSIGDYCSERLEDGWCSERGGTAHCVTAACPPEINECSVESIGQDAYCGGPNYGDYNLYGCREHPEIEGCIAWTFVAECRAGTCNNIDGVCTSR